MNLRNIISIIFLLTGISNIAGQITETMLGDITGRQIGPSRMSGRISCIDAQKKSPNIVWVGAAGGGVWKSLNQGTTFKSVFDVDDFQHFVLVQSDAALRKLAGLYPYDNFEDHDAVIALRSGGEEVNRELEREIRERLEIAGIEVIEARINYIAYAEEIANAMLRRQQASAVVSARFKIVEGAVSMVEMALEQLSVKKIVELDEEKKAAMVSNLMVVLCGDKDATPIVNTGTLHT